jgi:hypothetical protein
MVYSAMHSSAVGGVLFLWLRRFAFQHRQEFGFIALLVLSLALFN